jgi:RNA recognition motif-containing protein
MNIYIGNLSYKVDENDLRNIFEEYGIVTSVKIIKDKISGKSKGFAFVEMTDNNEANTAIRELNGGELDNRKVIINEARPKRTNNNRY